MAFFERPDPRLAQTADPAPAAAVGRALRRQGIALALCVAVGLLLYIGNVALGLRASAVTRGELVAPGLRSPVTIVRDRRDVPHIVAGDEHDLFFAEGFAQGSDRLFELDLSRRYAYGRLAEVLGSKALPVDERQRAVGVDGIARRQLRALAARDRDALVAFAQGVNAAARSQPLPVEFRMLLYRPAPWTPKDSVAVSVAASLELADRWSDVFARNAVWRQSGPRCYRTLLPLSDARYDVSVTGQPEVRRRLLPTAACRDTDLAARVQRRTIGSNAWGAGAARTAGGNALLANDPHLDLTIPGIWYLVDLQSPQMHAAGATIPGIPGVVLGHNERLAWAATNADMATTSVFEAARLSGGSWVTERFRVRLARDVEVRYYRTSREFSVPDENQPSAVALVRWPVYAQTQSTIGTALDLDRARSAGEALQILARYRGSPQNFIVADRSGAIAYHVAGLVPDDPAWGRYVHPAGDLRQTYAPVPFQRLPQRSPSRDGVLVSANNKPYAHGYPYRLAAQFEPPYRAYRIAQLLNARRRYDPAYFAAMQLDTLSPIDREIAREVLASVGARPPRGRNGDVLALLGRWDGRFAPSSHAAALEHALRVELFDGDAALAGGLSERRDVDAALAYASFARNQSWRTAGAVRIEHLLSPLNLPFLDGAWLPGQGDEYTIHLQEPGLAQGFRAVWSVNDWNAGGITIPSGESGEPGSGHYTDLTPDWVSGTLRPLPFGRRAVEKDATAVLVLDPAHK